MANGPMSDALRHLRRAAILRDGAGLTDGELLEAFIARHDGASFEALVRRHGPMVLGVCRRVLRGDHDAEDAFQATFLVLVKKASSVLPRDAVGNWLYGVAYRTAREARRAAGRRRARERQVRDMPHPGVEQGQAWEDLAPLLDQELQRLPEKYRAPVVLCHLQGRTRKEAARQLGLPVGTVSGRLTTARRLLVGRLRRHGLLLSGAALAGVLSPQAASACVPPALIGSTVKAATAIAAGQAAAGVVAVEVASLAKGVLRSLVLTKLKRASAVVLLAAVLGGAAGAFAGRPTPAGPESVAGERPGVTPPGPARSSARKESDRERLQGSWAPVSAEINGTRVDAGDRKIRNSALAFDGDRVTLWRTRFAYTLDTTKTPREMDIGVGGDEGTLRAIYHLDGDTLTLSWVSRGERPSDFDSGKSTGVVIVYRRKG